MAAKKETMLAARRKGLTLLMVRRTKHAYPRALELAKRGAVNLKALITHRVPLAQTAAAFALNAACRDGVVKIIVRV